MLTGEQVAREMPPEGIHVSTTYALHELAGPEGR
jgi:hypothetical protein